MTKHYVDPFKKAQEMEAEAKKASASAEQALKTSGVDLKHELDRTRTVLQREISQLMMESAGGLLCKDSSAALVSYIKLLKDLIKDENALIDNMSDDELDQIIKDRK